MTYVVLENCIKCKYSDCVVVCPVDCFHEGENMLVIDPKECIDCGVCEAECPANAIRPESEDLIEWMEFNKKYSEIWPVVTILLEPMKDADTYNGMQGKMKYFSEKPGNSSNPRKKGAS